MARFNPKSRRFASPAKPVVARVAAPSNHPEVKIVLTHDQIANLAYEVWLRKGKPKGQDEQNWQEAEVALRHRAGAGR